MTEKPVLLFDGVCNLCNFVVSFTIERDPAGKFAFASLQSEYGQAILAKHNLSQKTFDSFILQEGAQIYVKSTGALRVARGLGGLWPLMYGFIVVPRPIRDAVYSFIAKNRYRWFGKKDQCMIPSPEVRARFLG
jgi:predicted DCC family thiol-disulfide oxidoreductase YuxK